MRDTIIEAALTSARDTDTVVIGRGAVARTGKAIRDAMDTWFTQWTCNTAAVSFGTNNTGDCTSVPVI